MRMEDINYIDNGEYWLQVVLQILQISFVFRFNEPTMPYISFPIPFLHAWHAKFVQKIVVCA